MQLREKQMNICFKDERQAKWSSGLILRKFICLIQRLPDTSNNIALL